MNSQVPIHVVVSPARNEEKFIERTIRSMIDQTVKPTLWVLVDDGSTDRTAEIVLRYSDKIPWMRLLRLEDRGYYHYGTGIVNAVNAGIAVVELDAYDYITKLDCDLEFESDYFEKLFSEFEKDNSLGIAGGQQYVFEHGEWRDEKVIKYFAPGPAKTYKKKVFDQIGGLFPSPGWDTMDAVRAWSFGWSTRVVSNCRIHHLRRTGANVNTSLNYAKTFYILGGHPLFLLARCLYRLLDRPVLIGSAMTLLGYFWFASVGRPQKWPDPADRKSLRSFQMSRLLGARREK